MEAVEWVKCLLLLREEQSSGLWHQSEKLGTVVDTCNPCLGGVETDGVLEFAD